MSSNKEITKNRTAAFRLVYVQLIVTVVIALLSYTYSGLVSAYSVLLGSVVYILPNIYFVRCAFRKVESQTPQSMMSWFYIGEAVKILLTVALFAICFALVKPLNVALLFAAYIVMMIVNLAGMALIKGNIEETQNK